MTQERISVLFLHKMLGQWTGFSSIEKATVAASDPGQAFASPRREIWFGREITCQEWAVDMENCHSPVATTQFHTCACNFIQGRPDLSEAQSKEGNAYSPLFSCVSEDCSLEQDDPCRGGKDEVGISTSLGGCTLYHSYSCGI